MQQIKDEQIGLLLEETEKDIEKFKIIISEKDTQLHDLKNILQPAKTSYRKVTEENKQLKQHITATTTTTTRATATGILF